MKKVIACLLISIFFFKCSEKKETIHFVALKEADLAKSPFKLPVEGISDSAKHAHDNCMGFSFDVNAFIAKKDSIFIGTIINKKSFTVLSSLKDLGLTTDQIVTQFSMVTNPCYEDRVLSSSIKSIFGANFSLQLTGVNTKINKEINDAISQSTRANLKTGSWAYLDMRDALTKILDTAKSPMDLEYRKHLLDTSNIALTAVESIMNILLTVNTQKNISEPLTAFLKGKPSALISNSKNSARLSYVNNNTFEIFFDGFFPIVGQFTKAQFTKAQLATVAVGN